MSVMAHTVLLVHFQHPAKVFAPQENLIVDLVPIGECWLLLDLSTDRAKSPHQLT